MRQEINYIFSYHFYFIYIPELKRYKGIYSDKSRSKIKKIIRDLDIKIIDLHADLFSKDNLINYFAFDNKSSHFDVEGYKKVSKIIYDSVKD